MLTRHIYIVYMKLKIFFHEVTQYFVSHGICTIWFSVVVGIGVVPTNRYGALVVGNS